ncbi:MAG: ribonuclease HII [Candidatus Saccharibacteria bacterium]|nr:ribonuclease HII [Candidatus Saccharibacteria bacterium]
MHLILGIDEVGRGPWAGPLVMGGVILSEHTDGECTWIDQLTDSKKLTAKKRAELYDIIKREALAAETGWVSATELNKVGLAKGLRICCQRVVAKIQKSGVKFNEIIIDGPINFLEKTPAEPFVTNLNKADLLIKEVSAASIIAKVERDNYMIELGTKFPGYGFENHVGYGTAKHIAAIDELGLTPEHRLFIKPLRDKIGDRKLGLPAEGPRVIAEAKKKNTTKVGNKAEEVVANFLSQNGHEILARNFKTKTCEIDIVSRKESVVYFTEVKYRKNDVHGSGLDAITDKKQRQMAFAAEVFLKRQGAKLDNYKCRLAGADVSGEDFHINKWVEV